DTEKNRSGKKYQPGNARLARHLQVRIVVDLRPSADSGFRLALIPGDISKDTGSHSQQGVLERDPDALSEKLFARRGRAEVGFNLELRFRVETRNVVRLKERSEPHFQVARQEHCSEDDHSQRKDAHQHALRHAREKEDHYKNSCQAEQSGSGSSPGEGYQYRYRAKEKERFAKSRCATGFKPPEGQPYGKNQSKFIGIGEAPIVQGQPPGDRAGEIEAQDARRQGGVGICSGQFLPFLPRSGDLQNNQEDGEAFHRGLYIVEAGAPPHAEYRGHYHPNRTSRKPLHDLEGKQFLHSASGQQNDREHDQQQEGDVKEPNRRDIQYPADEQIDVDRQDRKGKRAARPSRISGRRVGYRGSGRSGAGFLLDFRP